MRVDYHVNDAISDKPDARWTRLNLHEAPRRVLLAVRPGVRESVYIGEQELQLPIPDCRGAIVIMQDSRTFFDVTLMRVSAYFGWAERGSHGVKLSCDFWTSVSACQRNCAESSRAPSKCRLPPRQAQIESSNGLAYLAVSVMESCKREPGRLVEKTMDLATNVAAAAPGKRYLRSTPSAGRMRSSTTSLPWNWTLVTQFSSAR